MIEFKEPPIPMTTVKHMELVELWEKCSSCVGFCIGLGEEFFSVGVHEVDEVLTPLLTSRAASGISPRVIPSYAILLWFTQKVWMCRGVNLKMEIK